MDDLEPIITTSELAAHRDPGDAWVAIDGVVYDLGRFLAEHPGGPVIERCLGRESGALIRASHVAELDRLLASPAWRAKAGIRRVGRLKDAAIWRVKGRWGSRVVFPREDDELGVELRRRVRAYLASASLPAIPRNGALLDVIIVGGLFFLTWYGGLVLGHAWIAALCGVMTALLGMKLGHAALHGGFARTPWIRRLAGHAFDFAGASSIAWEIEHDDHHFNTNTTIDTDLQHWPLLRLHPAQPRRWHHRLQHLYVLPLYSLVAARWWLMSPIEGLAGRGARRQVIPLLLRAANLALLAAPFFLFPAAEAAGLLAIYFVTTSYVTSLNFAVTHVNDRVEYIGEAGPTRSWTEEQIRTASDWRAGSRVFCWLSGGLNHQIEHHLFPTLDPRHYPAIAAIVEALCRERQIPYRNFPTFRSILAAHLRHLRAMGRREDAAERAASAQAQVG
ncbi:MAG: fatty acid desaturase [Myxococcales bacterium]|nr:fatty acid desaturase [Myxococcales bacterium]